MSYLFSQGSVNADLKGLMVFALHKQADMSVLVPCEVQEPHPQPPKSKRGGGYDLPHLINKRYMLELSAAAGEIDLEYLDKSRFCVWLDPDYT